MKNHSNKTEYVPHANGRINWHNVNDTKKDVPLRETKFWRDCTDRWKNIDRDGGTP